MRKILKFYCAVLALGMLLAAICACKKTDHPPDDAESAAEQSDGGGQENGDGGNPSGEEAPREEMPEDNGYFVSEKSIDATLISFNMEMVYNETERAEAVAAFLLKEAPSVVCLQEVWQNYVSVLQEGLTDRYAVLYKSLQSGTAEGLVIAYDKTQWSLVEENRFWLSETPDVKSKGWDSLSYAICYNVVLEHIETGVRLSVFNAKLDETSETARVGGMKLITAEISKSAYPVFFGCDLNAVNTSEAYATVTAELADCQNTERTDTGATYHRDRTVTGGVSTDFCFVSGESVKTDSFSICRDKYGEAGELFLSDHYAVKAEVRIIYKVTGRPNTTENGFDGVIDAVGQS